MNAPDRVNIDLRDYEYQQDINAKVGQRADQIAQQLANDLIADPDFIDTLITEERLVIAPTLARMLSNLEQACLGEEIGRRAILEALSRLEGQIKELALESVQEAANRLAWAERDEL